MDRFFLIRMAVVIPSIVLHEVSHGAVAYGFGDDTAAYRAHLDAVPTNQPASKEALVERASYDIERAMAAAEAVDAKLAAAGVDVS